MPGLDSIGNDISRISEVNTATALIGMVTKEFGTDNQVAAFNTNGWIKRRVAYPLSTVPSAGPLNGLYIRTHFMGYTFFPNLDSVGNDITNTPEARDDIPALIRISNAPRHAAGFNTYEWHKSVINLPMTSRPSELASPWQGTFVRHDWPDFVHLPGFDSPGNDIRQLRGQQLNQMIETCRNDPVAVAINTNGWLKRDLVDEPVVSPGADTLHGIYVKVQILPVLEMSDLATAFFTLKGTVALWCMWMIKDTKVRVDYIKTIKSMTDQLMLDIRAGTMTITAAAGEASGYRNIYMLAARNINSPSGMYMAKAIKPAGKQMPQLLERYTNQLTGGKKPFRKLESAQKNEVRFEL